ncbi:hypothetical protein CC86DRAFT_15261 [Ophiobolus disseminans]|uniref:Uncharacterized protein n=1 Tax=Ophiobolus disseminans TaxID=1469910 RepID=A0A6A7AMC8_9PLEO|nr:hypothetical protein CC86DRAFT_15261 [Ophiobolus disseminans]
MVLLRALTLVSVLLYAATATGSDLTDCDDRENAETDACTRPVEDVVPFTPGVNYTAKIRCYDCQYTQWEEIDKARQEVTVFGDVDMLFNVSLSHDNRSVLLNNQPFFPHLQTIPTPPKIWTPRVRPGFSYTNLSSALDCPERSCWTDARWKIHPRCTEWCYHVRLDRSSIDYLYTTKEIKYEAESASTEAQYWEFSVDAIGVSAMYPTDPTRGISNPSQKMLKVVVEGVQSGRQKYKGEKDMQAASSLFGPFGEEEKTYDYFIREVTLVDREYTFPSRKSLGFRQTISRFFGNDVWQEDDRRLVYIGDEWDIYGKEGTLRNMFGKFIHWSEWSLFWIIVFSVAGGHILLYGLYRLFYWAQAQRQLMKWNGMDGVWDNLRREREEEENRLLDGRYRDEPEDSEGSTPLRYTDDVDTMKPLPAKPLPDKPLPEVPLIDT